MISLVASDFELWVFFGCVVDVSFSVQVSRVNSHDPATDATGLRVPTHVIAYLKCTAHIDSLTSRYSQGETDRSLRGLVPLGGINDSLI